MTSYPGIEVRTRDLIAREEPAPEPPRYREPDPRDERAEPTFEQVHSRLRRSRVAPAALALACPEHAPEGRPCWPTGSAVCWPRVVRSRA